MAKRYWENIASEGVWSGACVGYRHRALEAVSHM